LENKGGKNENEGAQIIPLVPQVLKELKELQKRTGEGVNPVSGTKCQNKANFGRRN
jgi:hypothetical protein